MLAQQATLTTRKGKKPARARAAMREEWRAELADAFGPRALAAVMAVVPARAERVGQRGPRRVRLRVATTWRLYGTDPGPPGPVAARVYKLTNGQWVPTSATSPVGSGGPNGWTTTAAGSVSLPPGSLNATVAYGTLTASSATTSVSLGTTGVFAFAPTPPTSNATPTGIGATP